MVDDAGGVAAVLGAIGGVDLVVEVGVGLFHEGDIFATPPARICPSWRICTPRNQADARPLTDRT